MVRALRWACEWQSARLTLRAGSETLSPAEFRKALREYGVGLTDDEIMTLFERFDLDSSGSLDYHEFLRGVRGEISDRRRALVRAAYAKLARDASSVDADDIKLAYDAKRHPDVVAGKVCVSWHVVWRV